MVSHGKISAENLPCHAWSIGFLASRLSRSGPCSSLHVLAFLFHGTGPSMYQNNVGVAMLLLMQAQPRFSIFQASQQLQGLSPLIRFGTCRSANAISDPCSSWGRQIIMSTHFRWGTVIIANEFPADSVMTAVYDRQTDGWKAVAGAESSSWLRRWNWWGGRGHDLASILWLWFNLYTDRSHDNRCSSCRPQRVTFFHKQIIQRLL